MTRLTTRFLGDSVLGLAAASLLLGFLVVPFLPIPEHAGSMISGALLVVGNLLPWMRVPATGEPATA